jgi:AcrR family transcriptional regulator
MTDSAEAGGRPDLLGLALALVEERGWRAFSLAGVARRAGVPLARVYAELPTRAAVLDALGRRVDEAMLGIEPDELDGMSPRERVFELVMRRLDALAPYKGALRALRADAGGDLGLAGRALGNLGRATAWLVDASGAELGPLRRAGAGPVLAIVYGRVFDSWLEDDTPDLARTLAELDKGLRQAESLERWTAWIDGRREQGAGDGPTAPEGAL